MNDSKMWYESKTLWVFTSLFVGSLLHVFGGFDIPLSEDAGWVAIVLQMLAIFLRFITGKPIEIRKK
jgi:hypothetical protein